MSAVRGLAATLAATATAAGLVAGCGGNGDGKTAVRGTVAWKGAPQVFRPRALPHDRVLLGTIRNTSAGPLRLLAADVVVRDAAGHRLPGSAAFTNSYAHGLFGAFQQPSRLPTKELVRLGRLKYMAADGEAPFFAAWRETAGTRGPIRIQIGRVTLTVPRAVRLAAQ